VNDWRVPGFTSTGSKRPEALFGPGGEGGGPARMTRASMLSVLASEFVRTARASGLSPVTVIVSWREPTFRSALIVATNVPCSSMPSRLAVAKPVSENVTV